MWRQHEHFDVTTYLLTSWFMFDFDMMMYFLLDDVRVILTSWYNWTYLCFLCHDVRFDAIMYVWCTWCIFWRNVIIFTAWRTVKIIYGVLFNVMRYFWRHEFLTWRTLDIWVIWVIDVIGLFWPFCHDVTIWTWLWLDDVICDVFCYHNFDVMTYFWGHYIPLTYWRNS